ncbi:tail fiber domain-containing protein [bacterium]|nr:tail fiber domain-containing protein [bacterium]
MKIFLIGSIALLMIIGTAHAQMTVRDNDTNLLMQVNDEGSTGSVSLPDGSAPSSPGGKLYNNGGILYWSGNELGTAGSAGGWSDIGTVVRLTTATDKVGIGLTSPAFALDVKDSLGINGTRLLYLPDQTNFTGTLYLGDGGGSLSHSSSVTGMYNTAFGIGALYAGSTGYQNAASGYRALYANTSGSSNTAFGSSALYTSTTGNYNTAGGSEALYSNTTGSVNTAFGCSALYANTTGNFNTASGMNALYSNTTGGENTAIGCSADVSAGDLNNATAIGSGAIVDASNQVRLGNDNVTTLYCMGAYQGTVGETNRDLYADDTGKIGYISSSARYKENITDMTDVNWLYTLRPVNFTYKSDENHHLNYGLIAEEVVEIRPEFVSYDREGRPETVSYSSLITPLLKAVQDQQEQIEALKTEIRALKNE